MAELTNNDTIRSRVKTSWTEYERQQERYRSACRRFRDASAEYYDDYTENNNDDLSEYGEDQAIGGVNHTRTNEQTKLDSLAIADPDFHIDSVVPDLVEAQRTLVLAAWNRCRLTWWTRKALLNRNMIGLGILAYLYDKDRGPVFEHVRLTDFAPDPHFTDITNLRYATRRIRLPRDIASKLFPQYDRLFMPPDNETQSGYDSLGGNRKSNAIEFKVYWDKDTEATMYGSTIVQKGKNHYGKVPLIFLEGDPSPDRDHSTGDYDNVTGLQEGHSMFMEALLSQGMHGGPINLFNRAAFDKKAAQGLEQGRQQGFININGGDFERAIYRVPSEPVNPLMVQGLELLTQAIDEATSVNSPMRGTPLDSRTATESVQVSNQAGARFAQARIAYELFLAKVAETLIDLIIRFERPDNKEHLVMLQIFSAIKQIRVVETSTAYKDPAAEKQEAATLTQLLMPFVQIGKVDPDMLIMKIVRAWGERDPQKWIINGSPGMPNAPGIPGGGGAVSPGTPGSAPQVPGAAITMQHSPQDSRSVTHNPETHLTGGDVNIHYHEAKPQQPSGGAK